MTTTSDTGATVWDDDTVMDLREWFRLTAQHVSAALAILNAMDQQELPRETRYALTLLQRKLDLARWRVVNHPLKDTGC